MSRTFAAADVRAALSVSSEWDLPNVESVRSAYHCAKRFASQPNAMPSDDWSLFDWDAHGYDIAYDVEERGQPTGDCLCGGCAAAFLKDDDDNAVHPAYQVNGEIGDAESVYCDDCHGIIYAGEDLDYDKSNAA